MKNPIITCTLLLLISLSSSLFAQQTYALKPYAITLPRLTTAQQSTSAPQQAGNVVYNTDEQKLAVHNGTTWQYIAPAEAGQFQNEKLFYSSTTWTVPSGVTRILAEVWGGGAGGPVYNYGGSGNTTLLANGGGAGGYGRGFMAVTPGSSLILTVGFGGNRGFRLDPAPTSGESSRIEDQYGEGITSTGGSPGGDPGRGGGSKLGFVVAGGAGTSGTISYGQKSATEYILLIQCGNGGNAYSAPPGGFGTQIASLNSSVLLYQSGDQSISQDGSFPGGGGGCGYNYGGRGARGMIVIHF